MSEIRKWLEELDLGQYADTFEANAIEHQLLSELTDDALKELGIAVMGHRLKLLKAIRSLTDAARAEADADAAFAKSHEAERRQITVMFCDLVGSTALSEQLDPEDLRVLMAAYQKTCGAAVERYAGHVAQYLGDGLMIYFGWPQAHEDDAERSVRAGLEIVDAVKAVETPEPLQVRIGIATGPVVVGETGAGDAAVPKAAVGETPNIAARVQALAGRDQILIAPSTQHLTGGVFDYEDLGEQPLKGVVDPVRVWRVLGESESEGRFEAQAIGGLTPFVGRETEVATLLDRWQLAKDGEGQVVLICGEPGIGKSRITELLHQRLTDDSHMRLRLQCSPYHTNTAFYPLLRQLERGADLTASDDTTEKLKRLESFVALAGVDLDKAMPLFASLLSLPVGSYPPLDMSPEKQKALTIQAFGDQLTGLAAKQPVLFVFEDAHWADPTTLSVLDEFIDQTETARVLLIITFRPEFQPPWSDLSHVTSLNLNRLGRRLGAEMVAKVAGGKMLPDEVLDQIVEKTDGIPLFVEELTKAVLGSDLLEVHDGNYRLSGPLPPLAIPTTLQDSLMARLDRLSTVKGVAQIGACIGREFSYELLAAVSPMGGNELHDALLSLTNNELIYSRGHPPDALYIFKHTLVQEAAYTSLLKGRRQEIHALVAAALEQLSPETVQSKPELLAHHYTQAGLVNEGIEYWLKAARQASARLAYAEAKATLDFAITLLPEIADGGIRDQFDIVLSIERGELLRRSGGYAAPESGDAFRRAEALLEKHPNLRQKFRVNLALGVHHAIRAEFAECHRYLDRATAVADDSGDVEFIKVALQQKGFFLAHIGKLVEGMAMLTKSAALYFDAPTQSSGSRGGVDPGATVEAWIAYINSLLGFADQAREAIQKSIELARSVDHPFLETLVLGQGALTAIAIRDADRAIRLGKDCMELCAEQRLPFWAGWGRGSRGLGLAYMGELDEAVAEIEGATADLEGLGGLNATPLFGIYRAEAEVLAGQHEKALELLPEYERMIVTSGQVYLLPLVHLVAGMALSGLPKPNIFGAEEKFRESMRVARSQNNKTYELRAGIFLARLLAQQGDRRSAYDSLLPVYEWFTEGFDTADLKDAKALLDKLR